MAVSGRLAASKIAADAILDGDSRYTFQSLPTVHLKVSGIDLKSFGRFDEDMGIESFTDGDVSRHTWRRLCAKDGKLTGGVFVNSPLSAIAAISASNKTDQKLSNQGIEEILQRDG